MNAYLHECNFGPRVIFLYRKRSRTWPLFSELDQSHVCDQSVRVCLAIFTSKEAAASFAYESKTLSVPSLLKKDNPQTVLFLHLLELAPFDLYPLGRLLAHPAFLDFSFGSNPLASLALIRRKEVLRASNLKDKSQTWLPLQINPLFIHARKAPDRPASTCCHIPLTWNCTVVRQIHIPIRTHDLHTHTHILLTSNVSARRS